MEGTPEYMEKLLELKEDRCRRLQALISMKEARLAALRAGSERASSPLGSPLQLPAKGADVEEVAAPATPPPAMRRMSSDLVTVETPGRNCAPLGRLQQGGRKDYISASTRAVPGTDQAWEGRQRVR